MSTASRKAQKKAKRSTMKKKLSAIKRGTESRKISAAQKELELELMRAENAKNFDTVTHIEKMVITILTHMGRMVGVINRVRNELIEGRVITTDLGKTREEILAALEEEVVKIKTFKDTTVRDIVNQVVELKGMQSKADQFLMAAEIITTIMAAQEDMDTVLRSTQRSMELLNLKDTEAEEVTPALDAEKEEDRTVAFVHEVEDIQPSEYVREALMEVMDAEDATGSVITTQYHQATEDVDTGDMGYVTDCIKADHDHTEETAVVETTEPITAQ